jgi:uncharacterized protein YycO
MAKIFIGQYYGKSFLSRLIKWRTWSDISHTAAFLPASSHNERKNLVIEAWGKGILLHPWDDNHTRHTRIDIYSVECTRPQQNLFYDWLKGKIGCKYDFMALIGFVTRAHIESERRWFCSELIFQAAQEAGIELLKNVEAYKVSPGLINLSPLLNFEETRYT